VTLICALTSSGQVRRPVGPSRTSRRLVLPPTEANKCCTVCSKDLLPMDGQSSCKHPHRESYFLHGKLVALTFNLISILMKLVTQPANWRKD
jgi:hypothetical protein